MKREVRPERDTDDPQQGLELLLDLWDIWNSVVPASLRYIDPRILTRLLEVCDSDEGVPQVELRAIFKLDEPKMSRLSKSLKKVKWITDTIPRCDGRLRLTALTPEGRSVLFRLWAGLKAKRKSFKSTAETAKEQREVDEYLESFFGH